jgi:N-acetylglucosaminyldiphosphoundecaprenol N-acetyl-beta-D-mannosaminyltransferase
MMTNLHTAQLCPAGFPISILGVPFDRVTIAEAIDLIERMIASRRPHYLVTANVDFVVQAQKDVELRRILLDAHLVLCDGTPLVWASRLLGNRLPERVAGADLAPLFVRVAAQKGYRIFFLGATPAVARRAVDKLREHYPELIIAGQYSPPFKQLLDMDHDEITRRIREAKPDLLFVGFGCPKQEKWIAMHYRSLGVPVSIGVGGTIDFLAGHLKRAPVWMQRTGLEWTFRLLQEPRRLFKRYAKDLGVFGWKILVQWWHSQHRPRSAHPTRVRPVPAHPGRQQFKLSGRLDSHAVHDGTGQIENALAGDGHCLLDLTDVNFIDSTGLAFLIRLQKKLRATDHLLILLAPHKKIQRALKSSGLRNEFLSAPDLAAARHLIETRLQERTRPAAAGSGPAFDYLIWQGDITADNAGRVWDHTQSHITSTQSGERVIDLSGVRFIDSSGASIMARAKTLAQRERVNLFFTNAQPAVQNVLRHARLDTLLFKSPERAPAAPAASADLALSQD